MPKAKGARRVVPKRDRLRAPLPSECSADELLETCDYVERSAVPAICICPCCREPLVDPRVTSCCNAVVCAKHAAAAVATITTTTTTNERACPACDKRNYTADRPVGDVALHEQLDALEVHCPRRRYGCDWRGERRAICPRADGRRDWEAQHVCGGRALEGAFSCVLFSRS